MSKWPHITVRRSTLLVNTKVERLRALISLSATQSPQPPTSPPPVPRPASRPSLSLDVSLRPPERTNERPTSSSTVVAIASLQHSPAITSGRIHPGQSDTAAAAAAAGGAGVGGGAGDCVDADRRTDGRTARLSTELHDDRQVYGNLSIRSLASHRPGCRKRRTVPLGQLSPPSEITRFPRI